MHTQRRYATCPQGMSKREREREKRCIPKEGIPHAHKACQKKKKKKRKRKYSTYQKKFIREIIHMKEFHPPSTKNIHTLAHLDQGLWLVSPMDLVFDLAKYEKQVCHYPPYLQIHQKEPLEVGWKNKGT